MALREKILSMRMNEFGFSKVSSLIPDYDVFPNMIHIVKWEETEPMEIYSLTEKKMVTRTSYCYVIAELEWDSKERDWEFRSIGTRYLEDGTEELNKWILEFCNKYKVVDGVLVEVNNAER